MKPDYHVQWLHELSNCSISLALLICGEERNTEYSYNAQCKVLRVIKLLSCTQLLCVWVSCDHRAINCILLIV